MPPIFFVWIFYALCRVRCPHRTDIAHKAGYCHPERSEGSLRWCDEETIVLQCLQCKDSSGKALRMTERQSVDIKRADETLSPARQFVCSKT